jgi:hypothetical protein
MAAEAPDPAIAAGIDALGRRLKWTTLIALTTLGTTLGLGAAVIHLARRGPSRDGTGGIEGRRFTLLDERGKARAILGVEENGAATLSFVDSLGTHRASVGVGPEGVPALGLGDGHGALRAALAVDGDGRSSIGFFDAQRNLRARLGVGPDGTPALNILDDAQRERVLLSVEPGRSLLRIADRSGQTRIGLGLSAGSPGIVMFDEGGAPIGRLP